MVAVALGAARGPRARMSELLNQGGLLGAATALGVLLAELRRWRSQRMRRTGNVAQTDADDVWAEARELRGQLWQEIEECRAERDQARRERDHNRASIERLTRQVTKLEWEVAALQAANPEDPK